jgi:[acyl-carrier-protein] S-malonyltransferase
VIPLNVAGAFHSPLMKSAASEMSILLKQTPFQQATAAIALNADGALHRDSEEIRTQLMRQLDHPVLWVSAIQAMIQNGCSIFIETGSGRVLLGLLKRISKESQGHSTENAEALAHTLDILLPLQRRTS